MVSLGVSSPTRKSLPSLICPFPQPFQVTRSPEGSIFHQSHKIVEGVKNSTKFLLSSAEEKHVDIYMVMSTTKNKTRTKYSKEVSEKRRSQFLMIFGKSNFLTIQPVIEYLFKRDNLRLSIKYIFLVIAHLTVTVTVILVTINLVYVNLQTSG